MADRPYRRQRYPMPDDVRDALLDRGLEEAYAERPPYQRNDYLMWLASAKREATRTKRLAQMLDELERGGVYMNMKWNPR
ncbi:MAG: YdeI/OmpD-associated family protein [Dehalococcoidia bacterium]|nr:YdeI/OmpD-associated family protein [Dehalococcoidia bacterium]